MSIVSFLHKHHQHCDDLFVVAEDAVHSGKWAISQEAVEAFVADTELHFRAEEEVLFPAYEDAVGSSMGPTQVMRYEHGQMRDLFAQLRVAVAEQNVDTFAGAADTLLILMQQHNMKEENILYPMCDQVLDAADITKQLGGRLEGACTI